MWTQDFLRAVKSREYRWPWLIAIVADAVQLGAFPFFAEGALSPPDDVLDVVVGAVLCKMLGWHWAFLPAFAAELVPGVDLFPTWTAAVAYVTTQQTHSSSHPQEPEIIPPGPASARRP
jgi:hypothetical protein